MAYTNYNKNIYGKGKRNTNFPNSRDLEIPKSAKRPPLKPLLSEEEKSSARIEDLSYDFACRIVRLYQWGTTGFREFWISETQGKEGIAEIPDSGNPEIHVSIPKPLLMQVLRSGTSIAANMNEARHPQSDADFLSKANIALKEARETEFWLNLLHDNGYLNAGQFNSLNQDLDRILRILVTIVGKVSSRLKSGKSRIPKSRNPEFPKSAKNDIFDK